MKNVIYRRLVLVVILFMMATSVQAVDPVVDSLFIIASSGEVMHQEARDPAMDSIATYGEAVVGFLIEKLNVVSRQEKWTALWILERIGAPSVSYLVEALKLEDGWVYVKNMPEKCISIGTLASTSYQLRGKPIIATAHFNPPNTPLDPETGQGNPFPTYIYATQIAEVEVNMKTGLARVLKIIAAHDVGKAINPQLVRGQITGGILMGLGQALMEEIILKEGCTLNPNFRDYLIPTAMDAPEVDAIIVESDEPTGPFGAKGVGEASNIATAPAIINAIHDAVGIRIVELPATPEKILLALKEVVKRD